MEQLYIPTKQSNLKFYQAVPLYFYNKSSKYVLYKPAGNTLDSDRIEQRRHPQRLFIKKSDEIKSLREVQNGLYQQFKEDLKNSNYAKIKKTIIKIVEETFTRPISGSLEGLSAIINIIASRGDKDSNIAGNLLLIPHRRYNLFLHSANVMALAIDFCFKEQFSTPDTKILGLSALLHDVGKTNINPNIVKAANKLDSDEFKQFQTHTTIGYQLLGKCKFSNPDVKNTALQHHERIDGSGYPKKLRRISNTAQIVGLMDSYESLTRDDRPYRNSLEPMKALMILKNEVVAGKLNRKIFEKFAYSLM